MQEGFKFDVFSGFFQYNLDFIQKVIPRRKFISIFIGGQNNSICLSNDYTKCNQI